MHRLLLVLFFFANGCTASSQLAPLASERNVARALGENLDDEDLFDLRSFPDLKPPPHLRPCCAFGMDLEYTKVPGITLGNIQGVEDLVKHEYITAESSYNVDLVKAATIKKEGLLYTCRGGFIDTAHVHDNADLTLYVATRIAKALPKATSFDMPGDGARRTITLRATTEATLKRIGRSKLSTTLAAWVAYQLSIWHEIATWYGHEALPGFPEKVSAFSPEDLYSNALGIRMAVGIIHEGTARSRRDWNATAEAWFPLALRRLDVVTKEQARAVMSSLDGSWWTSKRPVDDWRLVQHRNLDIRLWVNPWLARDVPACANTEPLPLVVDGIIEGRLVSDFIDVSFEVTELREFPIQGEVQPADFPRIIEDIRSHATTEFGPGFDKP